MKSEEMVQKLNALARRGIFVNHQECELVKAAAKRIHDLEARLREAEDKAQVAMPISSKGETEPFWDDMWPTGGK